MTAESSWGRIGRLRSKVGRGMFLLFVGCALVPVGVMALVWYLEVRSNLDDLSARLLSLQRELWTRLHAGVPGIALNGHATERLPNTLNVRFPRVTGAALLAS